MAGQEKSAIGLGWGGWGWGWGKTDEDAVALRRRKVATLYLLENEGFHSGKDEGNITKAAQRHGSNPARLGAGTTPTSCPAQCPTPDC